MVLVDKSRTTPQRIYRDLVVAINDDTRVPGACFADKIHHLYMYHRRNYNKTTAQLIGEDILSTIKHMIEEENNAKGATATAPADA